VRSSLGALALVLMAAASWAADLLRPDPALSPAEVVSIQLSALQTNDTPEADAGIAQTWAFAHPDNKRVTGPLLRFAQMLKGPLYRILLGHRSHEIKEVSGTDDQVVFAVTVTSQTGEVVGYRWNVAKVAGGENAGAWVTISVSPPAAHRRGHLNMPTGGKAQPHVHCPHQPIGSPTFSVHPGAPRSRHEP
jgi:hypothetical protein